MVIRSAVAESAMGRLKAASRGMVGELSLFVVLKLPLASPPGIDGALNHYDTRCLPFPRHCHDALELNIVLSGRAAYLAGSCRYPLCSGTLVWLFPEQDHLLVDASRDFAMWVVSFEPKLVRRTCTTPATRALRKTHAGVFSCRIASAEVRRLEQLIREIRHNAEPAAANAGLSYLLTRAWAMSADAGQAPLEGQLHPAVGRAVELLSQDPSLTLGELAAGCGLSEARLSRLFPVQVGMLLSDFRSRQRIERFLDSYDPVHDRSMLRAALEAGFGSYPQFHRVFKSAMKMTPAAYKRRLLEGWEPPRIHGEGARTRRRRAGAHG